MPAFLKTSAPDFESRFQALLSAKREDAPDVDAAVAHIIKRVRKEGDVAVAEYTARFDEMDMKPENLAFSAAEIEEAAQETPSEDRAALELAAQRITAYHERQAPKDESWTDETGMRLGWRWTPVDAAGLYAPGGLASYPSSVLMNAIPAKVAKTPRVALCVPTPRGEVNPLVLYAAKLAGVTEIYRVGGAQAIAAMAYGTQRIAPVDVIVGPGNAYVAAAKRQVFGRVGIDSIAGPSEVLVIADAANNPDWIAMDLLAQAEHDVSAQSIVITDSEAFGAQVGVAVERALQSLPRHEIARASWRDFGAIITVSNMDEAAELSNRLAPEHLELCVADPNALSAKIRHAGAIFIGAHTPEAVGDYVGGPNHVLPTARSSRYASGLSVLDFMKRTTLAEATPESLKAIGPAAVRLAEAEGLQAHGYSVQCRLDAAGDAGSGGKQK